MLSIFFLMIPQAPRSTLFPYTTLFRFQNWLGEVGYVGSLGRNLLVLQNIGTNNDEGGPGAREILGIGPITATRSEEHTSELQSQSNLVCRLLLEKKKILN